MLLFHKLKLQTLNLELEVAQHKLENTQLELQMAKNDALNSLKKQNSLSKAKSINRYASFASFLKVLTSIVGVILFPTQPLIVAIACISAFISAPLGIKSFMNSLDFGSERVLEFTNYSSIMEKVSHLTTQLEKDQATVQKIKNKIQFTENKINELTTKKLNLNKEKTNSSTKNVANLIEMAKLQNEVLFSEAQENSLEEELILEKVQNIIK